MDDQIQEPEQTCEQAGPGYFLNEGVSDKMRGSLAAVYSQLLIVEKRSFFQIQPSWPRSPAGGSRI
ncbi:hypothetical protein MUK70_04560 [Dyadobacter chenwenxiniae]|uniref:Uncharacterized protein n=1 Tax=Dyadobacter chenwenxiniae TaxID=2906456 RepID=A0A9X1PPS1_9BACT|nr:hypothetical protein [Dyadobacter chenwenxiniae]MCF0049113.1 hypothetical protein [Dyadobacter chenwenxiniae]MCF0064681.1 hypothetical protein [Dyadobacter chenwenxiniae]UON84265.1 hypothetical protein MUK70_04560 [Dyadobacter chenwenxiniae]